MSAFLVVLATDALIAWICIDPHATWLRSFVAFVASLFVHLECMRRRPWLFARMTSKPPETFYALELIKRHPFTLDGAAARRGMCVCRGHVDCTRLVE